MAAADEIIAALRREAPTGEAMALSELRRATGLSGAAISNAVQSLRYAGKLDWDAIALAPSMQIERVEVGGSAPPRAEEIDERLDDLGSVQDGLHKCPRTGPVSIREESATERPVKGGVTAGETAPASRIAQEVAAEARESSARKARARSTGTVAQIDKLPVARGPAFDGTDLQALAIDAPGDAVQALQRRWGDVWPRLVAQARALGVRPIPHMVALIEAGLAGEGVA